MTNKDFYAYCRDQRKVEVTAIKREALNDVYGFMWECGVTKGGVRQYIEHQIAANQTNQGRIEAYQWLQSVFDGQASTAPQQSATLF